MLVCNDNNNIVDKVQSVGQSWSTSHGRWETMKAAVIW
jgi:hypothetical protein